MKHHPIYRVYYFFGAIAIGLTAFVLSCADGRGTLSLAERSEFGSYVYQLDSARAEQAVWYSLLGVSPDADSIVAILSREVPRAGLDTAAFFIAQLQADLDVVHSLAFDSLGLDINEVITRIEDNLTEAYLLYTTGQRYGFVRPDRLLNRHDTTPEGNYVRLFDYKVKAPDREPAQQHLTQDDRIDYLLESQPRNPLYTTLQACLDSTTDAARRRTLVVNMERCRWQMERPVEEGRRILVNIPSQYLWALGGDSVLGMRICCGAVATKTPLLHSAVTHIQVNPAWVIPFNILKNEIAPHAGDSAYFARHRYDITERSSGKALNPRTVTAAQIRSGRIRVSQRGGAGNSLGRIIFRFPNDFSVYLHDTSSPSAFQRERRTVSHGCVRVQKPFDLACFMMPEADEWLLDRLRISMDIKPETDRGRKYLRDYELEHPASERDRTAPHRLISYSDISPRVPLYILYYTAFVNPESGQLEFYPDLYHFDSLIANNLPTR